MNLNKFTEKAQEAVLASPSLASELNHAQAEGVVPTILQKLDADPQGAARSVREYLSRQPKAYGGAEPHLSPRMRVVVDAAQAEARTMQDEYVSTEHLLLGLLSEPGRANSVETLKQRGVTREKVLEALTSIRGTQRVTDQ